MRGLGSVGVGTWLPSSASASEVSLPAARCSKILSISWSTFTRMDTACSNGTTACTPTCPLAITPIDGSVLSCSAGALCSANSQ